MKFVPFLYGDPSGNHTCFIW